MAIVNYRDSNKSMETRNSIVCYISNKTEQEAENNSDTSPISSH